MCLDYFRVTDYSRKKKMKVTRFRKHIFSRNSTTYAVERNIEQDIKIITARKSDINSKKLRFFSTLSKMEGVESADRGRDG